MINTSFRSRTLPGTAFQAAQPGRQGRPCDAADPDQVQISSESRMPVSAPIQRPGKIRNLANQVATALLVGCVGIALVGCGVNAELDATKRVTTELSSHGKLSEPVCKKVKRQTGPDWLPVNGRVLECKDQPINAEQAARRLADGKEVQLTRYQQGHWEIPMLNGRTEIMTEMAIRETMKSPADAQALQARLGRAEAR
jgi:hypothetical protein